jgi:hypothetical protein
MSNEPDLFGHDEANARARYPILPGYKTADTSKAAAIKIAPYANTVRAAVLTEYVAAYPRELTADQAAALVGKSILTVRPRVSELRRMGLLEPTPRTLANSISGHTARALCATSTAMQETAQDGPSICGDAP